MEKSYVALEQKVCIVTGKVYDTDAILLDKHLKESFNEKYAVTGYGICPEEQEYIDKGYIIVVEIDESKSEKPPYKPDTVYRTGAIARIRKEVAEDLFNIEIETIMYAAMGTIAHLESLTKES